MDFTRKMALVPEHYLNSVINSQALFPEPYLYLNKLDGEMKRILEDKSLTPDMKVKHYGMVLKRFLGMRKAVLKDSMKLNPSEIMDQNEIVQTEVIDPVETEVIDPVPEENEANDVFKSATKEVEPEVNPMMLTPPKREQRKSEREPQPRKLYEPESGVWKKWR